MTTAAPPPTRERVSDAGQARPTRPAPSFTPLGATIQALIILLLLAMLSGVLLVLFAIASLLNAPGQLAGGLGGVTSQAARAASSLQQAIEDATDPNHPPRGLTYDTEFSSLQTWHTGDHLPDASQYVLSVQAIQRRQSAESADTALYAVIHAELRQPRESRLFGQLIRSDNDAHEHVIYKGETFRIGNALYRVNWISQEDMALAAATYRHPDLVNAPLKFAYD